MIWSQNIDGLGERLRSLVNTIVVAERLGTEFKVSWEQMRETIAADHSITPAEDLFADDFCAAHLVTREAMADRSVRDLRDVAVTLAAGEPLGERVAVIVTQSHLKNQAPGLFDIAALPGLIADAFARIPFAEPIEQARRAALSAAVPDRAVALHLRAGDVVYNIYRTMDTFHGKVVPYPLAIETCRRIRAEGCVPLIFGQDPDLLDYLEDREGAVLAKRLAPAGFTAVQAAMFDICLFGRCERVLAGSSGFSTLGAWIGRTTSEDPRKMFEPAEALSLILDHVIDGDADPRISDLQRAFACRAAFVLTGETLATREPYWTLARKAVALDPDNDFLHIVLACSLYAAGQTAEGDETLMVRLSAPDFVRGRMPITLRKLGTPPGAAQNAPYLDALEKAAAAGSAVAALCRTAAASPAEKAARRAPLLASVPPELTVAAQKLLS